MSLQNPEGYQPTSGGTVASSRGRVLAIANQKGGVGKTTTAINLATALAACEKKVLMLDLDPQGNASTGLGINPAARANGVYPVIVDAVPMAERIIPTLVPGMSICPAGVELSAAEIELIDLPRREFRLKDAVESVVDAYEFIIVDCPPALGLLTLNALVAADAVIVPLQTEFYALEGLSHLVRTIERVKQGLNPKLDLQGIVLTMYDRRNNLCRLVADDVRAHFGARVYNSVIPRNVRVSEAPSHGKPALLYDLKCPGSRSYVRLAGEVLRQEAARDAERRNEALAS